MTVPVDPYTFTNGTTADAVQVNARFAPLYAALAELRIIRGWVKADGTIGSGSGFTSARLSAGNYRVTFTGAFADVPALLLTPLVGSLVSGAATTTIGNVFVQNAGSFAFQDGAFYFLAVGAP